MNAEIKRAQEFYAALRGMYHNPPTVTIAVGHNAVSFVLYEEFHCGSGAWSWSPRNPNEDGTEEEDDAIRAWVSQVERHLPSGTESEDADYPDQFFRAAKAMAAANE